MKREETYFSENIGQIKTAEQLVNDPRLLRIALTAFGLEGDMQNKFLVRKVLEDGTLDSDALSNRFSDKRYFELSKAFGFGKLEISRNQLSEFSEEILESYKVKSFEVAVGSADETLRLAMSMESAVSKVIKNTTTDTSSWLAVLGNPPLKAVFEAALRVPSGGGQVNLDDQIDFLSSQLESLTGATSFSDLSDMPTLERIRQNFLLARQLESSGYRNGSSTALQLLQSAQIIRY